MAVVFSEANPTFQHEAAMHQMSPEQVQAFLAFEKARREYTTTRGEALMARTIAGMGGTLTQIKAAVTQERRSFINAAKQLRDSGVPPTLVANKITSTKTPFQMIAALGQKPQLLNRLG